MPIFCLLMAGWPVEALKVKVERGGGDEDADIFAHKAKAENMQ